VLRLPAVAGRVYPSNPAELTALVRQYTRSEPDVKASSVKACLVPHAGYMYSGHVAGAVFSRIVVPRKILILGVRHFPRGEQAAIVSSGAWRTPLGDATIDVRLAEALRAACTMLEVQLPFLQVLAPGFTFVPVALGTVRFELLVSVGEGIARALAAAQQEVLLLVTSDLNHYEDDATTRVKDGKAIERLLAMDARGLYDACRKEKISMCGLGPAVAMLTALRALDAQQAELVRYATSADVSGDTAAVVGYAGMLFH
jgi:AmmeMemoRadiSam system protein B